MIRDCDKPGHRPDNDRAQLAELGDSATIRPDSATRRNCWGCAHNLTAQNGDYNYCDSPSYTGAASDEDYRAVAEWVEANVTNDDTEMPSRDSDGCPGWEPQGWEPKAEAATVKESSTVRAGGWRGHLPLCRGPGGTMARRMRALMRGRR